MRIKIVKNHRSKMGVLFDVGSIVKGTSGLPLIIRSIWLYERAESNAEGAVYLSILHGDRRKKLCYEIGTLSFYVLNMGWEIKLAKHDWR